ncbi:MAG TPA: retention module-containing protein, partial [Gammaproteobacteria bacterium]
MATLVGEVSQVVGKVVAIDAAGNERVLNVGDQVFAGEVIQTGDGAYVAIALVDGGRFDLGRNGEATLDGDVVNLEPEGEGVPAADEVALSVEALQAAIEAGVDPTQLLPATAAGPASGQGTGPEGGGHSFVSLPPGLTEGLPPVPDLVTGGFDVAFPEQPSEDENQEEFLFDELPLAEPDVNAAVEGGSQVVGNVLDNDTPGDAPTTVVSITHNGQSYLPGDEIPTAAGGKLVVEANGSYTYTPPAWSTGVDGPSESFGYTIADADGDQSSSTLTIDLNDLPQANPDSHAADEGGAAVGGELLTNDDQGNPAATVVSITHNGQTYAPGDTIPTAAGGTLVVTATGGYTYTPPAWSTGVDGPSESF